MFLVTLFNRLATLWELQNRHLEGESDYYERKDSALRNILRRQLCGMDINESACVLACFSLYVALLDSFTPSDIATYIEKSGHARLPRLFIRDNDCPKQDKTNDIPVLFAENALTFVFDDDRFDIVIGNPPWGGGGRGAKDIAFSFLDGADRFLKPGGGACLLLPSRLFLNTRSDAHQAKWLASHTLERMVQLADFRFVLFPSANCPCMILKFQAGAPSDAAHTFLYDAPKFDASSRRQGLVLISAADRKTVRQNLIQSLAQQGQAHTMWKRLFWGTPRDQRFIDYLDAFPKLAKLFASSSTALPTVGWVKGEGIQPDTNGNYRNPMSPWWGENHLFLDARQKLPTDDFFLFEHDVSQIGDRHSRLFRSRSENRDIFIPPVMLVNKGFSRTMFCDFPVLFTDAFRAIHAPDQDANRLLFLTAYLKSPLAKYYSFHVGATMGVERDIVRLEQIIELPFPLPEDAPAPNAERIIMEVADLLCREKKRWNPPDSIAPTARSGTTCGQNGRRNCLMQPMNLSTNTSMSTQAPVG